MTTTNTIKAIATGLALCASAAGVANAQGPPPTPPGELVTYSKTFTLHAGETKLLTWTIPEMRQEANALADATVKIVGAGTRINHQTLSPFGEVIGERSGGLTGADCVDGKLTIPESAVALNEGNSRVGLELAGLKDPARSVTSAARVRVGAIGARVVKVTFTAKVQRQAKRGEVDPGSSAC